MKEMRAAFAELLIELAEKDKRIVLLEADLMRATGTTPFKEAFPERTVNCGVAEANMIGIASGLSAAGKIPFASTFACFAARRAYDQFFLSANYAQQNVNLVGSDPGILAALNGGTHMPFEDVGLMRNIPGLVVFEPCDIVSLKDLVPKAKEHNGSTYMRLNRKSGPAVYAEGESFELGKGKLIRNGSDVTLIASGTIMVPEALSAATGLGKEGISAAVIDMHTIKPIDGEIIVKYAEKTGAIVTCENHQVINGLGSAVAEILAENFPVPMLRVGVEDRFGQVGDVDYLKNEYGLTAEKIKDKAITLFRRKECLIGTR